ncbi:phenylalanine--tRNA ligase beta subunit-related protein [Lactobacillus delbrueckii]|uniref:phenylalanine--tRNA ligase beta subunit-related protein n=1 Tax=Lactobacillus delbrueckii TaxID=1584 RepID=UPI001E3D56F2|nr:phenylalanine--tRNA ligase beta subunit-related protein [Lactobacillus delbrueckii]
MAASLPAIQKKKGVRASIEALLKRIDKGEDLHPISPLVDVYNSVSLAHGVPIGIEDQDKLAGTMHLGQVHEGLPFQPVGADKVEPWTPGLRVRCSAS